MMVDGCWDVRDCVDYGLWLRTMGGPYAVPCYACLTMPCPCRADFFRHNTPSEQMRLADIVCQPSMVPLWNVEAGKNIRYTSLAAPFHNVASRVQATAILLDGIDPTGPKSYLFLRTISSTIMARRRPTV